MLNSLTSYDITIIGAGPAGSLLAYQLASQGIRVLMVEKNRLPRKKICAGGITVRASSLIPFDFEEVVEDTIYGVRLSYGLVEKRLRFYNEPLAYMVDRAKFDQLLATRAVEKGATLLQGVEVTEIEPQGDCVKLNTSSGAFSSPIVAAADGANSTVVLKLGLKKGFEYGIGINGEIASKSSVSSRWKGLIGLDWGIRGGYSWVFPKKDYLAVGSGGSFKIARKLRPYSIKLVRDFKLGEAKQDVFQGHLMPIRKISTPLVYNRILLLGDAAGLIDPLTGEGIYYAFKSAGYASSAIMNFVRGKTNDLFEYQIRIDEELMPEFRIARRIQQMNSITPRLFFNFLTYNDRFWRAFCRLLRGEKYYLSLRKSLNAPLRYLFY